MNCIGEIDENKSMLEQIDDYSVPGRLGGSYDVKDLKPYDKELIKGMAWMIDVVDNCEPYFLEDGESIIGKMKKEIASEVIGQIIENMLNELGMSIYSIMDSDEDYYEK